MNMTEQLQSLRMDGHKGCVRSTCGYFTKGTIFSSIFNLLTTIVGAGTLALPFAFKVGGLIFSSVVFFVILMIAILTGLFLYDSQRICKDLFPSIEIKGYSDLAELTFGKIGRVSEKLVKCAVVNYSFNSAVNHSNHIMM